uniref:Uncharacterized protein n=1 Tax=Meloidogyne enterolobii TaxID=390850 RepID=A0A6V7X6K5_MELEN|nr:unnamed protein product [Meloidogyne enterolobii]
MEYVLTHGSPAIRDPFDTETSATAFVISRSRKILFENAFKEIDFIDHVNDLYLNMNLY